MNWLSRFIPGRYEKPALSATQLDALRRWQALPEPDLSRPHFETRYIILNTEASGLDLEKDRLLAVGAIIVEGASFGAGHSYYAELGEHAADTLLELLDFVGKGPVVVFNAGFNRSMLERALAEHLGAVVPWLWLDQRVLLPTLFPERIDTPVRLAEWMRSFDIETFQRHHALGDCWVIAQLFLALQSRALTQGALHARALGDMERARRQLWRQP